MVVRHSGAVVADVRFLHASNGARIALTTEGSGPAMLVVPPWTTHLHEQAALSGHRLFYECLAHHHTVVLYDRWGTGLSDRDRNDFTLEADLRVLRDVADHLKLRRFALLGASQGGGTAATFAHREPRRVSHLILYGTSETGIHSRPTWAALRELMLADWPFAVQAVASVLARGGQPGDAEAFERLLTAAATAEMTVALQDAALEQDISVALQELCVPTLVLHRRRDPAVSVQAAVKLAGRIPGARLELLDDEPHVHSLGNVATLAARITAFTGGSGRTPSAQLTARGRGARPGGLRVHQRGGGGTYGAERPDGRAPPAQRLRQARGSWSGGRGGHPLGAAASAASPHIGARPASSDAQHRVRTAGGAFPPSRAGRLDCVLSPMRGRPRRP